MRFCYVDESGTAGDTPCVVFAGLVFDRTKRAKVTRESRALVEEIISNAAWPPSEIKSHHLYPGKKHWNGIEGRTVHIERLCDWFVDGSGGYLALSVIEATDHESSSLRSLTGLDVWTAGALHIALQIQKTGKPSKNNKGQSVLVFDEQRVRQEGLTELLITGPEFTDDYYGRKTKDEPFDQLIDTPLFAASHHLPLLQVADVFAYVIRQYVEVREGHRSERYTGEAAVLSGWYEKLSTRLLTSAARWPKRTTSALAAAYKESAPDCLVA